VLVHHYLKHGTMLPSRDMKKGAGMNIEQQQQQPLVYFFYVQKKLFYAI
jgi:hypothetical protein